MRGSWICLVLIGGAWLLQPTPAVLAGGLFVGALVLAWVRRIGSWRERTYLTAVAGAIGLGLWLLGSYGLIGIGEGATRVARRICRQPARWP